MKTHKVTVKGIDNDACYSQYRTGATRFSFDKNHETGKYVVARRLLFAMLSAEPPDIGRSDFKRDNGHSTRAGRPLPQCVTQRV